MLPDKQDKFWTAVLLKDRASDGQFVFAVSSTGIYCLPSCLYGAPDVRMFHFSRYLRPPKARAFELSSLPSQRSADYGPAGSNGATSVSPH